MPYKLIVNYHGVDREEFILPEFPKTLTIGRSTKVEANDISVKSPNVSRRLGAIKTSIINGNPIHSMARSPVALNKFRKKIGVDAYIEIGDNFVLNDGDIFLISNSNVWFQYMICENDKTQISENETLF